jgi:hypothetical protein
MQITTQEALSCTHKVTGVMPANRKQQQKVLMSIEIQTGASVKDLGHLHTQPAASGGG